MTFLFAKKTRHVAREQVYLPLFDTSRNGKIIVLRDPRESAENDRWIGDKRSAICNFSGEQNDVIQCNYGVRQSPFTFLLAFARRAYLNASSLLHCRDDRLSLSIFFFHIDIFYTELHTILNFLMIRLSWVLRHTRGRIDNIAKFFRRSFYLPRL